MYLVEIQRKTIVGYRMIRYFKGGLSSVEARDNGCLHGTEQTWDKELENKDYQTKSHRSKNFHNENVEKGGICRVRNSTLSSNPDNPPLRFAKWLSQREKESCYSHMKELLDTIVLYHTY
jgi:hypothetical protein